MRRLWTVLLVLAACGGGGKPTTTTPAATPPSPAVQELGGLADAVCACADDTCAQAAYERLLTRQAELEQPGERAGRDAAHDRGAVCYRDKVGAPSGAEAVATAAASEREICACKTTDCVDGAHGQLRARLQTIEDAVFTTGERETFDAHAARIDACLSRFSADAATAGPVIARWADETCACTDATCASEVQDRHASELSKFNNLHGDKQAVAKIQADIARARACVDKLEPPATPRP